MPLTDKQKKNLPPALQAAILKKQGNGSGKMKSAVVKDKVGSK